MGSSDSSNDERVGAGASRRIDQRLFHRANGDTDRGFAAYALAEFVQTTARVSLFSRID